MITLKATTERALRMIGKVEQTARTNRAKAPTFVDFANLRKLELVDFRDGAAGMTWKDLELTAAGREWLKPKLSDAQHNALAYFAGIDGINGSKPNAGTYSRLRSLGLIEATKAFPYHQATIAGLEWLGLPTTCPACSGPRDKHKRDCPVAMHEQAVKIEAEALTSYCTVCSYSLLFIHQTWIGHNGSETCAPGGSRHIAAPNRGAAIARILNKYGVDLSDWLATPEHPNHAHAVACVEIARIQLEQISTDGWGHPYVKAYSIALDVAVAAFLPKA